MLAGSIGFIAGRIFSLFVSFKSKIWLDAIASLKLFHFILQTCRVDWIFALVSIWVNIIRLFQLLLRPHFFHFSLKILIWVWLNEDGLRQGVIVFIGHCCGRWIFNVVSTLFFVSWQDSSFVGLSCEHFHRRVILSLNCSLATCTDYLRESGIFASIGLIAEQCARHMFLIFDSLWKNHQSGFL